MEFPDLLLQANSFGGLVEVILDLAPDLLRANVGLPPGERVGISVEGGR